MPQMDTDKFVQPADAIRFDPVPGKIPTPTVEAEQQDRELEDDTR